MKKATLWEAISFQLYVFLVNEQTTVYSEYVQYTYILYIYTLIYTHDILIPSSSKSIHMYVHTYIYI